MPDQNRGAYTPQSEAPLAFDPREPRGRGPAPMTLLVSAIILMALIVGVLLFYRHGVRPEGAAPQLVGAPVGDTKSAPPPAETASSDQAAGLQVYRTEATPSGEGHTPNFENAPEQPAALPPPRPVAPPPPVIAEAPLRPAKPAPEAPRPAPKPVVVAKAAPAPAVAARAPAAADTNVAGSAFESHTAATPARAASPAKPAAAEPAGPAKPKPAPKTEVATAAPTPAATGAKPAAAASHGGGTMVQIGAFSSDALAQKGLADTAAIAPGGKSRKVEAASKDGKTFYRAFVGGFATHADAVAYCETLKAKGKACFVK
jgi:hypothetical protein